MSYHFFFLSSATIGANYVFANETFLKIGDNVIATHSAFLVHFTLMLFWIEIRYSYGLKISVSQVHRLKESYMGEFKDVFWQKKKWQKYLLFLSTLEKIASSSRERT